MMQSVIIKHYYERIYDDLSSNFRLIIVSTSSPISYHQERNRIAVCFAGVLDFRELCRISCYVERETSYQ